MDSNFAEFTLHAPPLALFVTAVGRIYVLLQPTLSNPYRLIRMEDMTGRGLVTLDFPIGSGRMQLDRRHSNQALCVDAQERIYIADTYNHRIVRIDDMKGNGWTTFGTEGDGPSQFKMPLGVFVTPQGQIYVADQETGRIVRFEDMTGKDGRPLQVFKTPLPVRNLWGLDGRTVSIPAHSGWAGIIASILWRSWETARSCVWTI